MKYFLCVFCHVYKILVVGLYGSLTSRVVSGSKLNKVGAFLRSCFEIYRITAKKAKIYGKSVFKQISIYFLL